MPELAPHPWDPERVPATNAAAPLFVPPVLGLIHPALYLLASIFVLLTPTRNPVSLLAAPPSLSPPWRQQCRRPAQHQSHAGPIARGRQATGHPVGIVAVPAVQGGGGEGCRTQHPVTPGIVQLLDWVPPHGHPSSSSSLLGARRGGAPVAAVAGHGGSDGRDSGGGDNDMFCCGMWSYVCVFGLAVVRCVCW